MNEENIFRVLGGFLREFGDEVGGRQIAEMPAEIRGRLRDMAEGHLDENERASVIEMLTKNPDWIGTLAEAVKERRNN